MTLLRITLWALLFVASFSLGHNSGYWNGAKDLNTRDTTGAKSWIGSSSNCAEAWHSDTVFDKERGKEEKIVVLKKSRGVMSIQRELEVSQLGELALVVQMGRLNCSTSDFSLRFSVQAHSQIPNGSNSRTLNVFEPVLADTPADHLLPKPDMVYTLRLGTFRLDQVVIDVESRNITEGEGKRVLVRVDILDSTGTDEPYAGLFFHSVKLEDAELSSGQVHPTCPSVIVEDQFDISWTAYESIREVLRNDTVYFPLLDTPSNSQSILPHQFRTIIDMYFIVFNIEVRYDEFPIFSRASSIVQHGKWIFKPLAAMFISYSNFLAAKLILRWILKFGVYVGVRRGPDDPWLTPKSLIIYWMAEHLIFKRLGIDRLSWVLGLWSCNSEAPGLSLWAIFGKEFLVCLALRSASGLIVGFLRFMENE